VGPLFIFAVVVSGCGPTPDVEDPLDAAGPGGRATVGEPFEPIPAALELDPAVVELGARLFADPRLSGSGTRACVHCHDLDHGGIAPGEPRSDHPRDGGGPYNVPTIFNVAFNFRLNWQGTFATLEEHAGGPLMNPDVMDAGSWPALVARLAPYESDFVAAGFAEGVEQASIREALAAYERSLLTPDAPFDRYLRGEAALPEVAARGHALFKSLGCVSCHQGRNVGGNLFQRFGVMADAFEGRPPGQLDYGRQLLTGDDADAFVFRVPSLRNVAVTAPYFHDGSAPTLDVAVRRMGRVQLGYALGDDETAAIVAFLETLTGEYRGVPLAAGSP
jgi:cytochrome c peroxidase